MVTQFQSQPGSTQPLPAHSLPTDHEPVLIRFPSGERIEMPSPFTAISEQGKRATPQEISIGNLSHPFLRLRSPMHLEVSREGDSVGVWSSELEEMGYGLHLGAAIEDFQQTLVELFLTLEADAEANRLGPGMQELWQQMQSAIVKRA